MDKKELDILMNVYGFRYRTATEVLGLEERRKRWVMALLEQAYKKGVDKR
ncbi:hypothetical protein PQE74_gp098 [Bacillus phage vB_BanS_Chewbecca]|uniref:Uncharacterized protein n=3 Tax=Tsamsavirus TaxID=3044849 RepID=A0AAE8YV31_9CAUD|nr:hypothetical protein PQE72_gp123 [Bacillus phage vB_BanS_Skywalker]YP_010681001.1 hypothetical protein PQE73_gp105 [Bacillus phage vB_BanS_MrDarsey]YP_010681241.1 hypothetical protein PQE74_gp098 [Bacillus phage vB_BanS_Chewbecca]UGO46181.1 hypothetical protein CHEWBECCA_98 [Bacillus phage vB_BanS_Chewbecca]UGO47937.1 hypothetical protein MRDARSEY_105 [Bacillus phage vB_BanS_MrDarsey]UGO51320.1 hypothetical protein SKYWALKER_163 [Bacillus phage vB_BanS_Skywalker]